MNSTPTDAKLLAHELTQTHNTAWVAELVAALLEEGVANELPAAQALLGLSDVELGEIFGVSRQAVKGWLSSGIPAARLGAIADFTATAGLLSRNLRMGRIPAAIRRPAANLGGRSLLELAIDDGPHAMYVEVLDTFDLTRING